jgi:hypothetical protein
MKAQATLQGQAGELVVGEYGTCFIAAPDKPEPKQPTMAEKNYDAAQIKKLTGWTDAEVERADVIGFPKGRRVFMGGFRATTKILWHKHEVDRWVEDVRALASNAARWKF